MRNALRFWWAVIGAILAMVLAVGPRAARAQFLGVTASGEWGPGYGAAQAANGSADQNGDYWQTPQGQDKGAWFQLDLGEVVEVQGLRISWARCEDLVHCPPASVVVQTSLTAEDGSWKTAREIPPDEIPQGGKSFEAGREWSYRLPEKIAARYVRLAFPDGGQAGARDVTKGYLCLGEVEAQGPEITPRLVTIEGRFGKAEVNVTHPALVQLYLRGPDGRLTAQSLLAHTGHKPWARGGYTYVVADDQTRYESRLARPEKVELAADGPKKTLRILGIRLAAAADDQPAATENWTLSVADDAPQLIWKIERRWEKDFAWTCAGSPGLFFSFDSRQWKNSVTSTFWYDPFRIAARPSEAYRLQNAPRRISENHVQTIRDRDTWAIYKLWTNFHAPSDLRLEVEGGHLYRRGSFAFLSEAGAVTGARTRETRTKGQVEQITLKIGSVDKFATGYQLAVKLPDKATEHALRDHYQSVLNGGAVNDQKGFDFGNETDGWYYAGSSWMYGMAVAAGTPAAGQLSSHPYDAAQALREHLAHILSTQDAKGRVCFGYNQGGQWVDDNLHTILGMRAYLLHSGDLAFVRQNLPALERMLAYFIERRTAQGLFKLDDVGAHWYYDWISTSGVNGYYNAFFYKAAGDLAEMEEAAGRPQKAAEYRDLARSIKEAFNELFWKEDAPGGPRYLDWIDREGKPVSYFCDLCQWPPIAVGLASPEQARKIVATADARIKQIESEYGYQGYAGLSALWPVPEKYNPAGKTHPFGVYMNGGSLLCQTYWEIVARARAGDAEGAYRRVRLFARRAAETSWTGGSNSFDMLARPSRGGYGEPYLADMVVATAAVVHGVLGISPTWKQLEVNPQLPKGWSKAEVEVLYKGRRHRVTIEDGKAQIQPLEQILELPLMWVMDFNLKTSPRGVAKASNVEFAGPYAGSVGLKATPDGWVEAGTYQSPDYDWTVPARLLDLTVAAELNGGQVTATVETSADGFQTVRSQVQITVRHGVNSYPLDALQGVSREVRVRFDLVRGNEADQSPVVDGFRITGEPVKQEPR
ncbi:MAG: discoidin domain-containing protein [Planctomycetota bacterium]